MSEGYEEKKQKERYVFVCQKNKKIETNFHDFIYSDFRVVLGLFVFLLIKSEEQVVVQIYFLCISFFIDGTFTTTNKKIVAEEPGVI